MGTKNYFMANFKAEKKRLKLNANTVEFTHLYSAHLDSLPILIPISVAYVLYMVKFTHLDSSPILTLLTFPPGEWTWAKPTVSKTVPMCCNTCSNRESASFKVLSTTLSIKQLTTKDLYNKR